MAPPSRTGEGITRVERAGHLDDGAYLCIVVGAVGVQGHLLAREAAALGVGGNWWWVRVHLGRPVGMQMRVGVDAAGGRPGGVDEGYWGYLDMGSHSTGARATWNGAGRLHPGGQAGNWWRSSSPARRTAVSWAHAGLTWVA